MTETAAPYLVPLAARYRFDAHRCHYCGGRWHLTTGWLEGIGAIWKCDDCRERYLAEKENGREVVDERHNSP